jgi:DUF3048 family protein
MMVTSGWDRAGSDASHHGGNVGDPGHGPHRRAGADLGHGTGCEADCQLQAASPFTGEPVAKLGPVLAVKIDNIAQSRSQTGLSKADIVCALPVEGGLTSLLASFSSEPPNAAGPARSAREADLELLTQSGRPGFTYSGAKPKLLPVAAKDQSSADSGTTFTTAYGQPMTFAGEPVWVVLAAR